MQFNVGALDESTSRAHGTGFDRRVEKKGYFWHGDKLQTISSVVLALKIGQLAGSRQNANAANTLL